MAQFEPNVPVVTDVPRVIVDAGLKPGDHRFRLVVYDDEGNASQPAVFTVRVILG